MALRAKLRTIWSGLWGGAGVASLVPWNIAPRERLAHTTVNAESALALTAVFRACSLLADSCSSAQAVLYARPVSGGRVVDTTSAAARALATVTHGDFELWAFSTALLGNGYLRIYRDGTGAPFELRAVPSYRVSMEVQEGTLALFYRIASDPMTGEPEVLLSEADVIHARYRATSNRLMGVPPIVSCAPSFALALQSRDVQRHLFNNLSSPGVVLLADGKMEPHVARKLQAEFDENYRGAGTGKTAVLTNGLDIKSIVWKAADAQLLEQVQASVQDVARAFGIPQYFLEHTETSTYASASEATRSLYSLSLDSFTKRLADAIAQKLLSRNDRAGGAGVELANELIMPGKELSDFLGGLVSQGIISPNEARNNWLGLPDAPGGDTLRVPTGHVSADQTLAGARAWEPGRQYRRGTLTCAAGGLWRAATDTSTEPRHDSPEWDALVWGASTEVSQ